ncbi:MAG: RCC1 domain-containing protein, partial [Actinomycetes bacterium]
MRFQSSGGLWCWGRGEGGQLGNGTSGSGKWTSKPQAVTGFPDSEPATLTVQIDRPDLGRVVTDPSFIDCASRACSTDFAKGKAVRLTAKAAPGAEFAGWEGACTGGDDDCVVRLDDSTTVRAAFRFPEHHTLTVEFAGDSDGIGWPAVWADTGNGLPTPCGSPSGCQVVVSNGASIVLRAVPGPENTFENWADACTGTGDSCVISMDRDRRVVANMPLRPTVRITAALAGNAPGSVEDADSGLWCRTPEDPARPNRCSVNVPRGTALSLDATPLITGDTVVGGACATMASPCVITPRRSLTFTTVFRAASGHAVTVRVLGTGKGQVVGPGITCGRDCTSDGALPAPYAASYAATPATGSFFVRWEGPVCHGDNATCVASMPGPIVAIFAAAPPPPTTTLNVSARGTGLGKIVSEPHGVDCSDSCVVPFRTFDAVTL